MHIVLATDGSPSAALAIDLVARVEWPSDTTIRVVEAVETGAALFGGPWPAVALTDVATLESDLRRTAEATVASARDRIARPGIDVAAEVLVGRPASAIVEVASDAEADLIVLGSRGHGAIESMLLGSVSAEVVDHAPAPVLVARGSRLERIVLAWDGSACARVAADLLREWPIFGQSAIKVVSVADIGVPWWTGFPQPGSAETVGMYAEAAAAVRAEGDTLAQGIAAELRSAGLDAVGERREGDPAAEIIAAASASDADLVVMGTHGRTGLARILLGSVARNVLHHAPCSVLIAREPTTPQKTSAARKLVAPAA